MQILHRYPLLNFIFLPHHHSHKPNIKLTCDYTLILVNEDRQVRGGRSGHLRLLPHQFAPAVENVSNLSFRFTEQYPLKGKNTTRHYF